MATNVGINVAVTSTGVQQVTVQLQGMQSAAEGSSSAIDTLKNTIAGLGIGAAVAQLGQLVDKYSNVEGSIRTVTNSQAQANAVLDQVIAIATATRQPISDVASVYQKMAIQANGLGLSQNQLLEITDALGKSLVIQHTTAQSASGALLQFSQALGTGKVRAGEFNSILTGLPVLAQAIAAQFNTTAIGLKAMVLQGKLTSEQLAQAVIAANNQLNKQFAESANTLGQSFTVLKNAVIVYVGQLADSINASNTFGGVIKTVAANIDIIAKSLGAAAVAVGVWALATGGLTLVLDAVTTAVVAFNTAILANPLVAAVAVIAGAITLLYEFRNNLFQVNGSIVSIGTLFEAAFDTVTSALSGLSTAFSGAFSSFGGFGFASATQIQTTFANMFKAIPGLAETAINLVIGYFVGLYDSIGTIFSNFPQYFVGLFENAFNLVGSASTTFINGLIAQFDTVGDKLNLHIDPVAAFQPIQTEATKVANSVGAAFQSALGKNYVGDAIDKVVGDASALQQLKEGADAAASGQAGLDDATQKTTVDLSKHKKVVDTLLNSLRTLLNTIDPAAGAMYDMDKAVGILNQALARPSTDKASISLQQYNAYMDALKLHYEDILDPIGAFLDKLDNETDLLSLDGDARTAQNKLMTEELELRKKSIVATAEDIQEMQDSIAANIQANNIAQARAKILAETTDATKTYSNETYGLGQLFASGKLSADQYNQEILKIEQAFQDTQTTLQSGVISGFLQLQQSMNNLHDVGASLVTDTFNSMETSLVNFVTTGKLSFSGLVDSILADMVKIEFKVLASSILTSLFGNANATGSIGTGSGSLLGNLLGTTKFSTGSISAANATSDPLGTLVQGFASGGYTGNGGIDVPAGIVHGQEFVVNSQATAQPGVRSMLEGLNAGTRNAASAMVAPTVVHSTAITINNSASDKVSATASTSTDSQGNPRIDVMIDSIETNLANRVTSGRGPLNASMQKAFGLSNSARRS